MQLLTFLGVFRLETTLFTWKDDPLLESPYVVEALLKFKDIHKITVFLTPQAEEHENWKELKEHISKYTTVSIEPVKITSGQSEEDFWQLFDAVVNSVAAKSEIIFDITHAFRSIPFLAFLATAFLEKAKAVKVNSIYYAAFERNQPKTPIVDLTPAIKLLDWLTATEQFITTGSSVNLGQLLSTIQQDFSDNKEQQSTQPKLLEKLGSSIQNISRSLELIRSRGVLKETARFQKLPKEELEKEIGSFAKPFELLSERIQNSYSQFALSNPENITNKESTLQKHFLLICWYVKNEQGAQAILLAREWVVSAFGVSEGMRDYLDRDERKRVEEEINGIAKKIKKSKPHLTIATARTKDELLALIWSKLRDYRNDIAHTEMPKDSADAEELQKYVRNELIKSLKCLFPQYTQLQLT